MDSAGNAYVTGETDSTNFPTTPGAFQPTPGGVAFTIFDVFVAKILINPVPVIGGLVPETVPAGSGDFTLTVLGNGFAPSSVVRWNGADRTTRMDPTGSLRASIPASDVAAAGAAQVTVFTPSPGGGTSNIVEIRIKNENPIPSLTRIVPSFIPAGGPDFTLVVLGRQFASNAVVRWNGSDRPTTFVNHTRLEAAIPSGDIMAPGTSVIAVFHPAPGGGSSNPLSLRISRTPPPLTPPKTANRMPAPGRPSP